MVINHACDKILESSKKLKSEYEPLQLLTNNTIPARCTIPRSYDDIIGTAPLSGACYDIVFL